MQESSATTHGVFDSEFGFDSHEWSCSKSGRPMTNQMREGACLRKTIQTDGLAILRSCNQFEGNKESLDAIGVKVISVN